MEIMEIIIITIIIIIIITIIIIVIIIIIIIIVIIIIIQKITYQVLGVWKITIQSAKKVDSILYNKTGCSSVK